MEGPLSSYSLLVIHMLWNVDNDERIDPPIHTEYFLSGGATTLIFMVDGANYPNSLLSLSEILSYMVVPPDKTTFP